MASLFTKIFINHCQESAIYYLALSNCLKNQNNSKILQPFNKSDCGLDSIGTCLRFLSYYYFLVLIILIQRHTNIVSKGVAKGNGGILHPSPPLGNIVVGKMLFSRVLLIYIVSFKIIWRRNKNRICFKFHLKNQKISNQSVFCPHAPNFAGRHLYL